MFVVKKYGMAEVWQGVWEEEMDYKQMEMPYCNVQTIPNIKRSYEMQKQGFIWIDRTLQVRVLLQGNSGTDSEKVRMQIQESDQYWEEIRQIAIENLIEDSRFCVTLQKERKEIATQMISEWVEQSERAFVCLFQEEVIGFITIKQEEREKKVPFIHLAAVKKEKRMTGAAVSLYSYVLREYRKQGCSALYGRISSQNTAVMNLYASLGAAFSKPFDIYTKG